MLRFRVLAALLLLAVAAPSHAAVAAQGNGVRAEIARPMPPSGELPVRTRIGIGRESDEETFRELKRRLPTLRLGGRERFRDPTPAPMAAKLVANFPGLPQYYSVPYDAAVAVSSTQILLMTNNQFAIFDKATGNQMAFTLYGDFFGLVADGPFDPKCFYDPFENRFVMVAVAANVNPNQGLLHVAVSQTADANGAWFKYVFDATVTGTTPTQTWSDYPGVGYDDRNIYVATNQFDFGGDFQFAKLRCFSKQQLYSGGIAQFVDFGSIRHTDGKSAFSIKPARHLTASTTGHLLATRPNGGSYVTTWTVTGTFPSLSLSAPTRVNVGAYAVGPDAQQPGSSILIDTGDCRTQDVVWRAGSYYTAFSERTNVGTDTTTAVRYLEVRDNGQVIRDVTYSADRIWLYYPAVSADSAGNVALVYGRSSGAEYSSIYQTRMPVGAAFEPSQLLQRGAGPHTSGRWGDYNAVANDPADSRTIWLYGGYGSSNNRWGTWVASVKPSVGDVNPLPLAVDPTPLGVSDELHVISPSPAPRLSFVLKQPSTVELTLWDVAGRKIRTLLQAPFAPGRHEMEWDGRREDGRRAGPGVYWARMSTGQRVVTKKLVTIP